MKNISLSACLLIAGALNVFAQSNEVMKSLVREKAMNVIAKGYEAYATVNGDEGRAQFVALFTSDRVQVCNDLIGLSDANTLPVGRYADLFGAADITNKIVSVKNLTISEEPRKTEGQWHVTVSFDKQLSYYNSCGVFFSTHEFYDADYKMKAFIVYDEATESCLIERITGGVRTLKDDLPEDYFVVKMSEKYAEYDQKLSYHRIPLKFNSAKQVIMPGMLDINGFTNSNPEVVRLIPNSNDCGVVTIDYKFKPGIDEASPMRLKFHFDLPMGGTLKADGDDLMSNSSSSGIGFGLDFGYKFLDMGSFRLYGFAGLGLSMETLELGYSENDYKYDTDGEADIDGSKYVRHYINLKLNQKMSLTSLTIPVYANAEYAFTRDMAVYANLGLRFNMNMSKKLEDNGSSAKKVWGSYADASLKEADDAIKWAEAVKEVYQLRQNANGFGDNINLGSSEQNELDGVSGMSIDMLAGLGFRYTIPHSPLTIDLGANMVAGLGNVVKASSDDKTKGRLVYNQVDQESMESTEYVNGLTNQLKGVKRQSLMLSVGLIYNF
jgi:hypothetical protein